jgi:2-iminobutanoate/2-iminopropanoate deaminase
MVVARTATATQPACRRRFIEPSVTRPQPVVFSPGVSMPAPVPAIVRAFRRCLGPFVTLAALLFAVGCAHATPSVASQTQAGSRVINPPGIAPLVPVYSVALRAGGQVFVSGMTGVKPGTQEIVGGGVEAQTRQTLENIRAALTTAGGAMTDVAECTVFLTDMADYAAMNKVYVEFFPVEPPARAAVAVTALPRPAARVEIKCSAVLAPRR